MKTKCYCIDCKKHPLHSKRHEFKKRYNNYWQDQEEEIEFADQGEYVNCLNPDSEAFEYLNLNKRYFKYHITAYDGHISCTGFFIERLTVQANCKNEDDEY